MHVLTVAVGVNERQTNTELRLYRITLWGVSDVLAATYLPPTYREYRHKYDDHDRSKRTTLGQRRTEKKKKKWLNIKCMYLLS